MAMPISTDHPITDDSDVIGMIFANDEAICDAGVKAAREAALAASTSKSYSGPMARRCAVTVDR